MISIVIKLYQLLLDFKKQILFSAFGYVSYCKHRPSCSVYTLKQIEKHGTIVGLLKGLKRILTCY